MITYEVVYEDRLMNQNVVTVQADGFQLGHVGDAVFFTQEEPMVTPAVNKYLFTRVISIKALPEAATGNA